MGTQGRDISTLAPLRALRSRTPDRAWVQRAVGEGVTSCPRAGCGKSARPVKLKLYPGEAHFAWPIERTKTRAAA